jgi:membrane-bound lytic murein transglycosylase B
MDGADGPAFLTYHNFNVFKIWNRSDYFALSVGLIADQLKVD